MCLVGKWKFTIRLNKNGVFSCVHFFEVFWVLKYCSKLSGDLEIRFEDKVTPFLVNVFEGHRPSVVNANGPTKNHINTYGNYVPGAWNANDQCTACWEENLDWDEDFKVLCHARLSEYW